MRTRSGPGRAAAILLSTVLLAGCQTAGDQLITGSIPQIGGRTITIESIDGPPQPVFERLVAKLSAEAEAKQLPIVSRTGAAAYRVRLYLLAEFEGKKARISWVADLFDGAQQRVTQVTGVEPAGAVRKDFWQKVDDATLARIAAKSLEAIMAATGGGTPLPAPDAPRREGPSGPAVAFADPRR
jgi:hypothetical protein